MRVEPDSVFGERAARSYPLGAGHPARAGVSASWKEPTSVGCRSRPDRSPDRHVVAVATVQLQRGQRLRGHVAIGVLEDKEPDSARTGTRSEPVVGDVSGLLVLHVGQPRAGETGVWKGRHVNTVFKLALEPG